MFPEMLDGARVLYFTPKDDYGVIRYPEGEIADRIRYLAICRYDQDNSCYLFLCDEKGEVVNDWSYASIEECMAAASQYKKYIIWDKA